MVDVRARRKARFEEWLVAQTQGEEGVEVEPVRDEGEAGGDVHMNE